jgi:hypothetical protein
VTRGEGDTDFTVVLHAADAGTLAGAGIENDERTLQRVDLDAGRRRDA